MLMIDPPGFINGTHARTKWLTLVDERALPLLTRVQERSPEPAAGGGFWAAFLDTSEKGQRTLVDEREPLRPRVRAVDEARRIDHQHHIDRGAPRRAGIRDL